MTTPDTPRELNLYRFHDALGLVRISDAAFRTEAPALNWLRRTAGHSARHGFSFLDVIELLVAGRLRAKGVPQRRITDSYNAMRQYHPHPFACRVVTDERRVYFDFDTDYSPFGVPDGLIWWEARGAYAQATPLEVIRPVTNITFNPETGDADSWQIRPGVDIDPAVSWGAPRIAGRRITTHQIAALAAVMPPDSIVRDFDLDHESVLLALRFEEDLARSG
jgi:uncharacterized protein (DUF433 family)